MSECQTTEPSQPSVTKMSQRNFEFDVMLSYSWSDKAKVKVLRAALLARNLRVWFDEEHMRGYVDATMALAIRNSAIFVPCLSQSYDESINAMKEFRYASTKKKHQIAIRLEPGERCEEVEFNISPTLWFALDDASEQQINNMADHISREARRLDPLPIAEAMSQFRIVPSSDLDLHWFPITIPYGGFGKVSRGLLDFQDEVVFKNLDDYDEIILKRVQDQLKSISSLSHPRLLKVFGITDGSGLNSRGLILEFISRGSIYDLMMEETSHGERPSVAHRLRILLNTAIALKVLIGAGILASITLKNIFVDHDWLAKVCVTPDVENLDSEKAVTLAFSAIILQVMNWTLTERETLNEEVMFPDETPIGFHIFFKQCSDGVESSRPSIQIICECLSNFLTFSGLALVVRSAISPTSVASPIPQFFNSLFDGIKKLETAQKRKSGTPPPIKKPLRKVVNQFVHTQADEIDLNIGDNVMVNTTYSDGWCRGRNFSNKTEGLFPVSSLEPEAIQFDKRQAFLSKRSNSTDEKNKKLDGEKFDVSVDYISTQADEIKLNAGDIVEVMWQYSDGWCKGKNLTTKLYGIFPYGCLEIKGDNKK
ncbi:hypothetical protein HK096_005249 [Nowakowskiella sp. JEL0078]|nr:hypothetical protein HK096_005249 [Nowakowskiella sp. JEL0078]